MAVLSAKGESRPDHSRAEGRAARDVAVAALHAVMVDRRAFEEVFNREADLAMLAARDRAFARAVVAAALRRSGELRAVIGKFLEKPLPAQQGRLDAILLSAAAQLLILKTPPHAVISLAVDQCRADREARRFDKLANAVLRRVSERGGEILASLDGPALNIPPWMLTRWRKAYGEDLSRAIAKCSLEEPPLDVSVKEDAKGWADRFGGVLLPTGSVRLAEAGRVDDLDGFKDGSWWVQDTAATLPARVLGDVQGLDIADLCAAPGGKTAQLLALGAKVTAVELSPKRAERLNANLTRLKLDAKSVVADVLKWAPGQLFDAVLLDAPCTATGTIRRHPDILYLKREADVASLAVSQAKLLAAAARLVKPGGRLVYCTCSLEPEEGPQQVAALLVANPNFRRLPIDAVKLGGEPSWQTRDGDLRTLPCFMGVYPPGCRGMDGFYVSLLIRTS